MADNATDVIAETPQQPAAEAVIEAAKPAEAAAPAPEAKAEKALQPKKAAVRVTRSQPVKAAKSVRKARPAKAARIVKKAAAKPMAARTKSAPAPAAAQTKRGVKIMASKTNNEAAFFAADQFKNVFGDVNERAKTAMEKSAKIVEELADIARGNVEAIVASGKLAAKGVETLSQDAADYGRKSFEEASATMKSFAEVKSATDFFKLQSEFARSAFDAAVAETARASEAFLKIAGDVAEPITSRYTVAAERVKTLAA